MKVFSSYIAVKGAIVAPLAGGRGLKACIQSMLYSLFSRPPRGGAWIEG